MKRVYDSMNSSVEISSYRDQHFKVRDADTFLETYFISLYTFYNNVAQTL